MKARKFFAFVAAAGMLFAGGGCTPNEEGEPATSEALVYVLSSESMTALSGEETVETIELTTNGSWDVVVPEEHSDIVVTPLNGKGNATVTVTVPAYEGERMVTLTFNFSKKTNYPVVGVIDENQSLTFTISQNAAGVATTPIANLVAGENATVMGVLSAVGSKASILTDATGSVVLYGNPADDYVVGTKLTVTGKPFHYGGYDTNALQFDPKATDGPAQVEVVSTGNTVDYNPQVLTGAEVDQLVGAGAVCTEVQFEGTAVLDGSYVYLNIQGGQKQAQLYNVTASKYYIYLGAKVTVKGYIVGTYKSLNVLPYSVETTEKIIYCADIEGVAAAGVENETVTIQTLNITGEVSAEGDGQIVTAASVDGNVLTYTVAANSGDSRDGEITLSADGVEKKVKVSQLGAKPESYPYAETFATSLGAFAVNDANPGTLTKSIWYYNTNYKCACASGNNGGGTESWLISPKIDMTGATAPVLTFSHAVGDLNSNAFSDFCTLHVKEATAAEWTALTIENTPTNWTFVESGNIDLSAYANKTIQIAFKYVSTADVAPMWEIQYFKVDEKPEEIVVPEVSGSKVTIDTIGGTGVNQEEIQFEESPIKLVVAKGSHSTSPRLDADQLRVYGTQDMHNTFTVSSEKKILQVTATCASATYATAMAKSAITTANKETATVVVDGSNVVITVLDGTTSIELQPSAQFRTKSVVVTYAE